MTAKDLDEKDLAKLSANNIQQLVQKGDIDLKGLLFKVKIMLGNKPNFIKKQPDLSSELPKIRKGIPEILIIEDNPDNMVTIKAIIGNSYNIREAWDGLEGLRYIISRKPNLVLLDISLPKIDGIEVVKILKGAEETKDIPIIAVTARAMKEDEDELLKAGCDDYIAKPVDPKLLKQKINKWLKMENSAE